MSIFFRKLITTILLRKTITHFFFRKQKHILLKNELKRFQIKKSKTKLMYFREKNDDDIKNSRNLKKNKNFFTILNHFTISNYLVILNQLVILNYFVILNQLVISNQFAISNHIANFRINLFRIRRIAFINYHNENFLINFDFIIIKKFVLFCQIYKQYTTIQVSRIYNDIIYVLYLKTRKYYEKNELSYQYIFSFSNFEFFENFSFIFFFVFIFSKSNFYKFFDKYLVCSFSF